MVRGQRKGQWPLALQVVALQLARILLRAAPGQNGRFAAFGPGGGLGRACPTPWAYDGVPGEGSIPVPLPPPWKSSNTLITRIYWENTRAQSPKQSPNATAV